MTSEFDPTDWRQIYEVRPDPEHYRALWWWIYTRLGLALSIRPVCRGHASPYDILYYKYSRKPHTVIVHGPRGGGKTLGAAIDAHLACRWSNRYGVRILGGSKQQSAQVYEAIEKYIYIKRELSDGRVLGDADPIADFRRESAEYKNGSSIAYLAASSRSVRGPHVPRLILDEIDEQDPQLAGAAAGMVQEYEEEGHTPQIEMMSTWHRVGGLMSERIERAERERIPFFRYCIFDVLGRCPDDLSGEKLEKCPDCPIFAHCWADRLQDGVSAPRAKLGRGHYTVRSLIQKTSVVSEREFEADYLCMAPRADGIWFAAYSDTENVDARRGEFNPLSEIHVAIDYGVRTYACFFNVKKSIHAGAVHEDVAIFAEYFGESLTAAENAHGIAATAERYCSGRLDDVSMDSAAWSPEGAGTTGFAEYNKAGLRKIRPWNRVRSRKDNYTIVESFIRSADGARHLFVHPRCKMMRAALLSRSRARSGRQWLDFPAKPDHPHEDVVDALAGGLNLIYPRGRISNRPSHVAVPAGMIA